jgi:hypothetical protein
MNITDEPMLGVAPIAHGTATSMCPQSDEAERLFQQRQIEDTARIRRQSFLRFHLRLALSRAAGVLLEMAIRLDK